MASSDPAIRRHFRDVDHILHAGDIGKRSVIEQLEQIAPVTAVSGNVDDGEQQRISVRGHDRTGRTAASPSVIFCTKAGS